MYRLHDLQRREVEACYSGELKLVEQVTSLKQLEDGTIEIENWCIRVAKEWLDWFRVAFFLLLVCSVLAAGS